MSDTSPQSNAPLRIVFLTSGGGRTMLNVAQAIHRGDLNAQIVAHITSTGNEKAVDYAQRFNIPNVTLSRKEYSTPHAYSDAVWTHIRAHRPDLVCMGGFLSFLHIPPDYENRVMNIHPALLPKFGGQGMWGMRVHQAVLDARETISGCTVHFANNEYDAGPILVQRTCSVEPDDTPDTLAARVFEEEKIAYLQAIRQFADRRTTRT